METKEKIERKWLAEKTTICQSVKKKKGSFKTRKDSITHRNDAENYEGAWGCAKRKAGKIMTEGTGGIKDTSQKKF